MKSLFPEMDKEIADERKAARREEVQRAGEYINKRDVSWLVNRLLDGGPANDHKLMWDAMEEEYHNKEALRKALLVLQDLVALWVLKKLWRRKQGIHPRSGDEMFIYGVRGVHHAPNAPGEPPEHE